MNESWLDIYAWFKPAQNAKKDVLKLRSCEGLSSLMQAV